MSSIYKVYKTWEAIDYESELSSNDNVEKPKLKSVMMRVNRTREGSYDASNQHERGSPRPESAIAYTKWRKAFIKAIETGIISVLDQMGQHANLKVYTPMIGSQN